MEREEFLIAEPPHAALKVDSLDHLAKLYEDSDDPWAMETSPYEARKRRATLAALPRRQYRFCFEPGASIGMLTAELAQRAERVEAWEPLERPLAIARRRLLELERSGWVEPGRVRLLQQALGAGSEMGPAGADLVVLSEVLYYIDPADLPPLVEALTQRAADGAHIIAVHWRHPVAGWPGGGATTHEALLASSQLAHRARVQDADYIIDVLRKVRTQG